MSRPSTRCAVQPGRHVASTPAVAGFRPAGAALAIAAAFGMQPALVQAQPTGAQAIHGTAALATSGNKLTVTTTNGAQTNHSAINWQSFSVPKDTITHFQQPTATSTSINRVVGPNPSPAQRNITEIYGTLSSNGRLVLVNPEGIAIGKGGMVDTAGFTASTLGMSKEDALAARLRFNGGSAALQVDGTIRSVGGDVVLIAPKVQTGAESLVRSDGAVVLAAGQKAELTGRGLEGIHLEVQAGSEVVNLGKLQGDAVGMFAGTLRHSGHVLAQAVSTEGGKVVLKAAGDALVNGSVTAAAGAKGGSIDVLGQRVGLLAGTSLDASGDSGGGQIRVGGDYQGKNAEVPNATRTYVDAQATLRADAGVQGDGGRVIVWSDELTRMHGQISARGGAQGGNGGFAEASGKQYLEFTGRADLRAPKGAAGLLLLDPEDVTIVHSTLPSTDPGDPTVNTFPIGTAQGAEFAPSSSAPVTLSDARLNAQLSFSNVRVTTSSTVSSGTGGQITLNPDAVVTWDNSNRLSLRADKGIQLDGTIRNTPGTLSSPAGGLHLEALSGGILGNGVIEIGSLWATAVQNTSTDPAAGQVRLTNAGNKIGVIAGSASGTASEFRVVNSQGLTVDTVDSTFYAGGSGIIANAINLTTLTGPLSIRPNNTLSATGSGGITLEGRTDVQIDSNLFGNTGLLKVHAGHDILAATTIAGAFMQLSADQVELRADNNLVIGNSLPPPPSAAPTSARVFIDGPSGVVLQAGQNISFQTTSAGTGSGAGNQVRAQGSSSTSTGVHIDATAGSLDFGASTYVKSLPGGIDAHAGTSLVGGGAYFDTQLAGSVHLTASKGSLSFAAINTSSGSYSGNAGGEVRLRASGVAGTDTRGDISGGSIFTGGTYGSAGGAKNGGDVDILATGGDVSLTGAVTTTGSPGTGTTVSTPGGAGGAIRIEATAQPSASTASLGGNITLNGGLDTRGGSGLYGGGAGGNITLRAMQGSISAEADMHGGGGSATNTDSISSAGGGAGATITIDAGGNIQLGQLLAPGGSANRTSVEAPAAVAGAGGIVRITSTNGSIALGRLAGASVLSPGGAQVLGGTGVSLAAGGAGGSVTLSALGLGGQVSVSDLIDTRGGEGGETAGGNGGSVGVGANSSIRLGNVYTTGGYDWTNSTFSGPLTVASATGNIELAGHVEAIGRIGGVIDVSTGGDGALITVQSTVDASAHYNYTTGVAPDGGTIRLESREGGVTVNGSMYARAGNFSSTAASGGSITIQARDDVNLGYLYASGVSYGSTGGGTGGTVRIGSRLGNITATHISADGPAGGLIDIKADTGDITIGSALVRANASFGLAGGGAGGTILLTALGTGTRGGNITAGGLDAGGGGGIGTDGGAGGTITVKADKQVVLGYAHATGGRVSTGSASGGMGGKVGISSVAGGVSINRDIDVSGGTGAYSNLVVPGGAGGDVVVTAQTDIDFHNEVNALYFVRAEGGAGQQAAGGKGGTITLQSRGGQVAYVPPPPPAATDTVTLMAVTSSPGGISASGGQGAPGGAGGTIEIKANGPISAVDVLARGGAGSSSLGGAGGGMGGAILLSGGSLAATLIDASGGNGEGGRSGTLDGGSGGHGGSVTATQNSGDFSLSDVQILADGGSGGHASGADAFGGAGGNGGTVVLTVSAGSLAMGGGRVSATAGNGGSNGDDVSRAADGARGSVTVLAANDIDTTSADLNFGLASFTARAGGSIDIANRINTRGGSVTISAGDPGAPAPDAGATLNVGASIDTTNNGEFAAGAAVNLRSAGVMTLATPVPFEGPPDNSIVLGSTVTISAGQLVVGSTTSVIGIGGVAVSTDGLVLDGFIDSDAARTTIEARSSTRAIHLGGADETGTLNLTQAELDRIDAGRLVIGSLANMGGLVVDTPITLDTARIPDLGLVNGGAVTQATGATLTVGTLGVKGGSVVLDRVMASGPVLAISDTSLQLQDLVSSTADGDAVALSAVNLNVGPAGAIGTPAGRWLVYLSGPLSGNNFGTLASNNLALWNRTFTGSPPGTVSESGNRYLFAFQPTLSVSANSFSRVYDGSVITHAGYSASALVDAAAFGNVFLQDAITGDITVLNPSKNVGSYAITRGTLQAPAGYAFNFSDGTGTITQRDLHLGVQAQSKVYDGSAAASVAVSSDDRVSGDSLGFGVSGSFSDKNAGSGKTVNLFGYSLAGADAGNYRLVAPSSTTASISQRGLSVAVSARDKVYDGNTGATLDESDNRVAGDALGVAVTGAFSDKNAGSGKTVNLGGYSLSGADAGNYFISNSPSFALASITRRSLAVQSQAQNKVYDGTTAAAATASAQPLAGDSVTVGVNASFVDKNAGSAKPVNLSFSLSGADADNYALPSSTGTTTADIARRSLQVGVTARDKTYDATTAAPTSVTDNRVAGDALTVGVNASFSDKNVGAAKPVSLAGYALAGADAGNYVLANAPASSSASITPAPLTIAADNLAKVQGVEYVFQGTEFSATGLQGGEAITRVSLSSAGAPATAPTGAYSIVPSNPVGGNGYQAGNYAITLLNGVMAVGSPQAAQQVANQVVTFANLFVEQSDAQQRQEKKENQVGQDDIVITDTSCRPS